MKTFAVSLLLSSLALAGPVELVERATPKDSDICTVAQTQGSVCGQQGTLSAPKVLRTLSVNTADDCVAAVHTAPKALSGRYTDQGEGGQCTLYTAKIAAQGYTAGSSPGTVYFDKACLKCRACQLGLTNGNFETGALTPWTTAGAFNYTIATPGATQSKNAARSIAKLAATGTTGAFVSKYSYLQQNFEVCKGTSYTVSALVRAAQFKSTNTNSQASIQLATTGELFSNPSDTLYTPNGGLVPGGTYQVLNFTYTPAVRSSGLVFTSGLTGTDKDTATYSIFVDNVAFTVTS